MPSPYVLELPRLGGSDHLLGDPLDLLVALADGVGGYNGIDERNPEGRDPEYGMTAETAKASVEHGFFFDDVLAKMRELRDEG